MMKKRRDECLIDINLANALRATVEAFGLK